MRELLDSFILYMTGTKESSHNTVVSYKRDILKYIEYLDENGIEKLSDTDRMTVVSYLLMLKKNGMAAATVSRSLAAVRAFYSFAAANADDIEDPTANIMPPPAEKKQPEFLTAAEAELLMAQPKSGDVKGLRDRAMLELLYATGIKVSEIIELRTDDINLKQGLLRCRTHTHERIVPIGKTAVYAVRQYLDKSRSKLASDDGMKYLFLNRNGEKMSRQGFWKILKGYGKSAGIKKDITPHTIRHSFAMHLLQNGADLEAIRQLLGHSEMSSTQVYSKLMDSRIKQVYEKAHPRA